MILNNRLLTIKVVGEDPSHALFGSGTYHVTVFRNFSIFTKLCKGLYTVADKQSHLI